MSDSHTATLRSGWPRETTSSVVNSRSDALLICFRASHTEPEAARHAWGTDMKDLLDVIMNSGTDATYAAVLVLASIVVVIIGRSLRSG
jgi:hypothetical protein